MEPWKCNNPHTTRVILLCKIGDWTHQVQWCAASLLLPVSSETFSRLPPTGPRHDPTAGYRHWGICSVARYSLVCAGIAPVLCLCYHRHRIKVLRLSTLESDDPENGNYMHYFNYMYCYPYFHYFLFD